MYFDAADFGHRVKRLREEQGMTQEALADKLAVGFAYVSRFEGGTRTPSIDIMIELAEVFHVSLDYLVIGKHYKADSMKNSLILLSESLRVLANEL